MDNKDLKKGEIVFYPSKEGSNPSLSKVFIKH